MLEVRRRIKKGTDMWEDKGFKLRLEGGSLAEYEKVMLSSGQCEFFMPMGFIASDEGQMACYDCSGFCPLSSYRIERTEDALYLLERTMIILGNAVQYFISPAKVTLTTDTVFYNKDTGQVKIAYVPVTEGSPDLRRNLTSFIDQLKVDIRDGRRDYLDETVEYIYYKNYYISDIITKVALMKRQIYAEDAEKRGAQ